MSQVPFYLKVHLCHPYAFDSIQHWVDIVQACGGKAIFVCDSLKLRKQILKRVRFLGNDVQFIRSQTRRLLTISSRLVTPEWRKIAAAHLATFYHASKYHIDHYWNIDADDTMLVSEPEKIAEIIKAVQEDCEERGVQISSLDMWRSRSRGKQWTFGVTYTRNVTDVIPYFSNSTDEWKNDYKGVDCGLNLDWFITSLLDKKMLKIETFYVENLYFIHWCRDGNFLKNVMGTYLCYWCEDKVHFPFLEKIFNLEELGIVPIASDCKKYSFALDLKHGSNMLKEKVSRLPKYCDPLKKLWHISY